MQRPALNVSALGSKLAADMLGNAYHIAHKPVGILEYTGVYPLDNILFTVCRVNEKSTVYMPVGAFGKAGRRRAEVEFRCYLKYFTIIHKLSYLLSNGSLVPQSASGSGYSPAAMSARMLAFTGSLSAA